jgi:molybdopterin molybdotransferase
MLTIEEALDLVLERARPLPPTFCPLPEALHCVLDEDVVADMDSPPFDKALMDGYAVRSGDLYGKDRRLRVGEVIMAGQTPARPLGERESAVVMTGAPVPPGTDAVVMLERTHPLDGGVVVDEPNVRPGQNILRQGREMRRGEIVVARGSILSPVQLGVLASVGRTGVTVIPRPRVVILPTGDELVEPGQVPGPSQIRNSNAVMLQGLAIDAGAHAETRGIVPDDMDSLRTALRKELACDVLVITGGVSAGHHDLVPPALESLEVERVFHRVRIKPGKPLWFGVGPCRGARPGSLVFGLPGNPVSGLVGFLLFVRTALAVLAGGPAASPKMREAGLSRSFVHRGDRPTFHPARLGSDPTDPGALPSVETLAWSGSADLRTASQADGFAVFAAGDKDYLPGEVVRFLPMREEVSK